MISKSQRNPFHIVSVFQVVFSVLTLFTLNIEQLRPSLIVNYVGAAWSTLYFCSIGWQWVGKGNPLFLDHFIPFTFDTQQKAHIYMNGAEFRKYTKAFSNLRLILESAY